MFLLLGVTNHYRFLLCLKSCLQHLFFFIYFILNGLKILQKGLPFLFTSQDQHVHTSLAFLRTLSHLLPIDITKAFAH